MSQPITELLERFPVLRPLAPEILSGAELLVKGAKRGKILLCGNGGSAADCEHIAGELMKGFTAKRPLSKEVKDRFTSLFGEEGAGIGDNLQECVRAFPLTGMPALSTAYANDEEPSLVFSQQLFGLGDPGDVLVAISTSGNSRNVIFAAMTARVMGLEILALTGASGGRLKEIADVTVAVPEGETRKIQELHLPLYHALCLHLEREFFDQ